MVTQRAAIISEKQPTKSSQQAHIQRLHREERLAKYEQVLALLKQGMIPIRNLKSNIEMGKAG